LVWCRGLKVFEWPLNYHVLSKIRKQYRTKPGNAMYYKHAYITYMYIGEQYHSTCISAVPLCCDWGDWKHGTGKRGTIKNVERGTGKLVLVPSFPVPRFQRPPVISQLYAT